MRQNSLTSSTFSLLICTPILILSLIPGVAKSQKADPGTALSGSKPLSAQETAKQEPKPAGKPKRSPPSKTSKSANIRHGEITALDIAAETLVLKERTGRAETYVFTPKTHFHKSKKVVEFKEFKVGDAAVVHFRRSRTDGAMVLSELDDPLSWDWLAELRKTIVSATIKSLDEETMTVSLLKDSATFEYGVSEKTRWEKAGKESAADQFKAGDRVYIVPRSLPSGGVMARAVADSQTGADQGKERTAISVHGTILTLEPAAFKFTLKTLAGDTRNLAYTDAIEVKKTGKPVPFSSLKAGEHVSVRLRHEESGDEIAWRITVETSRKTTTKSRKISSSKQKASTTSGAPSSSDASDTLEGDSKSTPESNPKFPSKKRRVVVEPTAAPAVKTP